MTRPIGCSFSLCIGRSRRSALQRNLIRNTFLSIRKFALKPRAKERSRSVATANTAKNILMRRIEFHPRGASKRNIYRKTLCAHTVLRCDRNAHIFFPAISIGSAATLMRRASGKIARGNSTPSCLRRRGRRDRLSAIARPEAPHRGTRPAGAGAEGFRARRWRNHRRAVADQPT
ncbi:MAG: hypothetical protein AB7K04_08645 [Pseudorhodoplanes sp.]